MSYPRPPEGPGGAGPYGQQPEQGAWPQGPGMAPPPPNSPQAGPPIMRPPNGTYNGPPQGFPQGPPQGGWAPQGNWAPQGGPGMPGPPGMPPGGAPGPVAPKSTGRNCLTIGLALIGTFALLGGGGLVASAYSNQSQNISNSKDFGPVMWRAVPVDKLLPEALATKTDSQSDTTDPDRAEWHRLGIATKTKCDEALSGATAAEAKKLGCKGVLRATYIDPTGNTVATVALIALPKGTDSEAMHAFFSDEQDEHPNADMVTAHPVPGTPAAAWSDANRNGSAGNTANGIDLPLALAASAGAADGRKAGRLPGEWGRAHDGGRQDRRPWNGAAESLITPLNAHLSDLLLEETT